MIEIVSATKLSIEQFPNAPLGRSKRRLSFDHRLTWDHIAYDNRHGLPVIYNRRISTSEAEILIFVHDDVWIDDFFVTDHVIQGLATFDVIGLAGNRRRAPNQEIWAYVNGKRDDPNLQGAVAHGPCPFGEVTYYGDAPAQCELLDGVFLAAKRNTLLARSVHFDERFDFHFYDLDFCRTVRTKRLSLGAWPIAVTHSGHGAYGSPEWNKNLDEYRSKWKS